MDKELNITLKHWDYVCGDRFYTDYGTEVLINDELVEHPDSTEDNFKSSSHIGDDVALALRAVLSKLGYKVNINYE